MMSARCARGRAAPARLPRGDARRRRRGVAAPRGGAPDVRVRRVQRRAAVLAHRLGREAHRLDRRGDRAGDGADLRVRRRAPLPASRARVADPVGRRRARARGRGGADGRRPARRLVGSGGDARGRAVVALVRRRRHVRAAPAPRHARPGARDRRHARSAACCSCRSRSSSCPTSCPAGRRSSPSRRSRFSARRSRSSSTSTCCRCYGNPRISLVAYVMPAFAIAYGALFLDEPITTGMVIGLALILLGVALGSGLVVAWRRPKTVEEIL